MYEVCELKLKDIYSAPDIEWVNNALEGQRKSASTHVDKFFDSTSLTRYKIIND